MWGGVVFALIVLTLVVVYAFKVELPNLNADGERLTKIETLQAEHRRLLDKELELFDEGDLVGARLVQLEGERISRRYRSMLGM